MKNLYRLKKLPVYVTHHAYMQGMNFQQCPLCIWYHLLLLLQSPEVQASSQMEKEGLIRGLQFLEDNQVKVESLTTDRHPGTKKYMRTMKPDIAHYFDVCHVAKGMQGFTTVAIISVRPIMGCGVMWEEGLLRPIRTMLERNT